MGCLLRWLVVGDGEDDVMVFLDWVPTMRGHWFLSLQFCSVRSSFGKFGEVFTSG